ncbi:MAG: hypothetical protein EWM45_16770 [Rhodopseudomonas palustris]|nr:MAG: hypothetical protein EWM45_16770 [Rhodopseudomonas palustris]
MTIAAETQLGMLSILRGRQIAIGPRVKIGSFSVIDTPSLTIGEGTRIGNQVVVGGLQTPKSALHLGRNCILMEWSFVNTTLPVTVGDDVGIGGHSLLFTHGLWPNAFEGFPVNFGEIKIEDGAWLAWRVSVLPGVTIGSQSILSSDACVTKDIPPRSLAAGVPAKVLRENGSYIAQAGHDQNRIRLANLLNEFVEWVQFNGGQATHLSDRTTEICWGDRPDRQAKIIQPDEHNNCYTELSPGDLFLSLRQIPEERRQAIEATRSSWLDLEAKERSITGNALTDELEEFLRRAGLRLLKYDHYRRDMT